MLKTITMIVEQQQHRFHEQNVQNIQFVLLMLTFGH